MHPNNAFEQNLLDYGWEAKRNTRAEESKAELSLSLTLWLSPAESQVPALPEFRSHGRSASPFRRRDIVLQPHCSRHFLACQSLGDVAPLRPDVAP